MHGHVAREFVLEAIDLYFRTHYNLKWRSAVVLGNDDIAHSQVNLVRDPFPLLIQVFSSYWTYDKFAYPADTAYVWPADSIYESIAVWMHQCVRNYRGVVAGVDVRAVLVGVLNPPEQAGEGRASNLVETRV
jgi:hypothetical protein